jgi:uncharacterized protein with PIN domain
MNKVTLVFLDELNDFLPADRRNRELAYPFDQTVSVKHGIESCGVPHTEVGRVTADGKAITLDDHLADGQVLKIYPTSPAQFKFEGTARFVLDNHLGKLADFLRLLCFDALYHPDWDDEQLAQIAAGQSRVLLTRDRGLLKRKIVALGYCVRNDQPGDQVAEVLDHFGIAGQVSPYKRCAHCNGILVPAEKSAILDRLQPLTRKYYDEFTQCQDCGQIYWKGSHYIRMQPFIHRFTPPSREQA